MANVAFTPEEEELLSKGLKHCFRPLNARAAKDNLVADLAVQIGPGWNIHQEVSERIQNMHTPLMDHGVRSVIQGLRSKVISHHLTVSKADKGGALVIMDKQTYHTKLLRVIEDMGGKVDDAFNFDTHVGDVRRMIGECGRIIKTLSLKNAFLVMNPSPPMLYGLPKVHKTGMPLRPVVSYVSTPTYLLAKFLDRWFKSTTDFTPPILCQELSDAGRQN